MAETLTDLTVRFRVLGTDDACGTGFHCEGGLIVTCAHVVNAALGSDPYCAEAPERVPVDGGDDAEVIAWFPPRRPTAIRAKDELVDIAVLRAPDGPQASTPARLVSLDEGQGGEVETFGYPVEQPMGLEARGRLAGLDAGGWHIVERVEGRPFIEGGFSGAPLISAADGGVIGMVVQEDRERDFAHMIPTLMLWRAWPKLAIPYKGLDSFDEADAGFFAGRDELADAVAAALEKNDVVTLFGPSGSGKSSLVKAGVLPRLRRSGWRVATVLPGRAPMRQLTRELVPLLTEPVDHLERQDRVHQHLEEGHEGLLKVVDAIAGDGMLVLFFDQFEEIYGDGVDGAEREAFIDLITPAGNEGGTRLRIAVTVRIEFLGHLLARDRFNDAVSTGLKDIKPMRPDELTAAIVEPAARLGVRANDDLIEAILADVRPPGEREPVPGYLPLLSFALHRIWREMGATTFDRAAYLDTMGGLHGALRDYAEDVFHVLSEERRGAAARLFDRLVDADTRGADTRRQVALAALTPMEDDVARIFVTARLLTTGRDADGKPTIEIAHEALMSHWPTLCDWIETERRFKIWRQQLAIRIADWKRKERDTSALLTGSLLLEAEELISNRNPSGEELDFIQESRAMTAAREWLGHVSSFREFVSRRLPTIKILDFRTRTMIVREIFQSDANIHWLMDNLSPINRNYSEGGALDTKIGDGVPGEAILHGLTGTDSRIMNTLEFEYDSLVASGLYENPERRLMQIWIGMVSCITSRGDLIYLIKSLVLSSRYPTGKPIVDSISSRSGTIDQYYAIKLLDEIVNHFLTIASMDEGSTLKNLFCILSAKLRSGDRASVFQTVLQVILRNYITYDQGKGIGEGLSFLLSALESDSK